MITQFEMCLEERPPEGADVTRDVALLESILRARTAMPWMTRKQIAEHVRHVHGIAWSERYVRTLASASKAVASAPGSRGYAFADLLPVEQLAHVAAALISQGRAMMRRGIHFRQAAALKHKTAEMLAVVDDGLAAHLAGEANP
jgi:hypothetical protein